MQEVVSALVDGAEYVNVWEGREHRNGIEAVGTVGHVAAVDPGTHGLDRTLCGRPVYPVNVVVLRLTCPDCLRLLSDRLLLALGVA